MSDAGPLIHLDELNCCDLMEGLGEILIPQIVWQEATRHRPHLQAKQFPQAVIVPPQEAGDAALQMICRSLDLDAGERAALHLMKICKAHLFLTDDSAARLAGEMLGHPVRGSIGLIVRAIRRGTREVSEVRELLLALPQRSTLHLSRVLLQKVLSQIPTT